ncbi:MAG: YebC/PmpR family DNA-binding transcriptional regulator [Elusimicrobiota bacterium]|jgi:YebC/PmpR family DNA-binding regulatory protein|nr:YebC/PmpR family DNA-binding transcriptional regulator [Elusimicrobiota bacterium]
MSGHNKWASIKHKKAATDAKRGNLFTKIVKEITIAAKNGGSDPATNARLRTAIDSAKGANMPLDNIKKAIQRGTGELPGVSYEEMIYEGYGPGGIAIIVEVTTDNKNRTVSEIRKIFSIHNGNLGETGAVSWMFDTRGLIEIDKISGDEDKIMELALQFGAEDFINAEECYEVYTDVKNMETIKNELEKNGCKLISYKITKIPQTKISLEGREAEQMLKLMDKLDSHDDVQNVYANFDIADDIMEKIELD